MRVSVLGLGRTLEKYHKWDGLEVTIGVNDIFKYHSTDFLILLDMPRRFTKERLKTILSSQSARIVSHLPDWDKHFKSVDRITLTSARGDLTQLDGDAYPYSCNSPFVACVLAYRLGAKEIVLYGVDFTDHKSLSDDTHIKMIHRHYRDLYNELKRRGVSLSVCSKESRLSEVIPISYIG